MEDLPTPILCFNCKKNVGSKTCGECGVVQYCSRECQVNNWRLHRLMCRVMADRFPLDCNTAAHQIFTSSSFELHLTYLTEVLKREIKDKRLALIPFTSRKVNSLRTMAVILSSQNIVILSQMKPETLIYGIQVVDSSLYGPSDVPKIMEGKDRISSILLINTNEGMEEIREVSFSQAKIKEKDQAGFDTQYHLYLQGMKERKMYQPFIDGKIMLYFMGTYNNGKLTELDITGCMPVAIAQ